MIRNISLQPGKKLFFIAGPCVIESRDQVVRIAEEILEQIHNQNVDFIFKASYDKANRTSGKSFRGPGIEEGMKILSEVQEKFNLPVLTDVHNLDEVKLANTIVDIIQIPAFLCRQTDLIHAAAATNKPINLKKGQFLAPWDMKNVVKKVEEKGNKQILITERGTSFGYNTLVSDMRSIPIMRQFGYPVVYDGTHSVQQPGGLGNATGGNREHVYHLTRAAIAAGTDGIFLETHYDPDNALSDGPNMIPIKMLGTLIEQCVKIFHIVNEK